MKVRVSGKKYSRLEVSTLEQGDSFEFEYFSSRQVIDSIAEKAARSLAKKGLLNTYRVYQRANVKKSDIYEASDDPQDIEKALEMWRCGCALNRELGKPQTEPPKRGYRVKQGVEISWQSEVPDEDFLKGMATLEHYVIKVKGFAHDSMEGLWARIISLSHRAEFMEGDARDWAMLELGRLWTLASVYSGQSERQNKNAKNKNNNPRLNKALSIVGAMTDLSAKEKWDEFFGSLESLGADPALESYQKANGTWSQRILYSKSDLDEALTTITFETFSKRPEIKKKK